MTNPDKIIQLLQDEVRAAAANKYGRSLESADAHTTARARREYIDTLRAVSTRAIESIQEKENSMSKDQTSNHNTDDQEQEQDPADLSFPAHWPVTGPFANNTDDQE